MMLTKLRLLYALAIVALLNLNIAADVMALRR
jgi:hypothetical protein